MEFKDGTDNPHPGDAENFGPIVQAGAEAPAWMRGSSDLVACRIRIALEHRDYTETRPSPRSA